MKHRLHQNKAGFTIVELMIATVVFSLILLLCATAIVQVGRMYYKGVVTSQTTEANRRVTEDLAEAIQFGPKVSISNQDALKRETTDPTSGIRALCIGGRRYTIAPVGYHLGSPSSPAVTATGTGALNHIVWQDAVGDSAPCLIDPTLLIGDPTDGQELVTNNMRVVELQITRNGTVWTVDSYLAYGEDPDVFAPGPDYHACANSNAGGSFCATSSLSTKVVKRL